MTRAREARAIRKNCVLTQTFLFSLFRFPPLFTLCVRKSAVVTLEDFILELFAPANDDSGDHLSSEKIQCTMNFPSGNGFFFLIAS